MGIKAKIFGGSNMSRWVVRMKDGSLAVANIYKNKEENATVLTDEEATRLLHDVGESHSWDVEFYECA